MPLNTLQGLLVGGAIVWALFPFYGAAVFAALELLLVLTVLSKSRAARKYVASAGEQLDKTMTPEARAWVSRFAMHFVWPKEAKAYGNTLKMTSLMMGLLALWLVARAVITFNFSILVMLVPLVAVFAIGVAFGGKLEPDLLVEEDRYRSSKPLHEEATKVLALLSTAGRWAPTPPP